MFSRPKSLKRIGSSPFVTPRSHSLVLRGIAKDRLSFRDLQYHTNIPSLTGSPVQIRAVALLFLEVLPFQNLLLQYLFIAVLSSITYEQVIRNHPAAEE